MTCCGLMQKIVLGAGKDMLDSVYLLDTKLCKVYMTVHCLQSGYHGQPSCPKIQPFRRGV